MQTDTDGEKDRNTEIKTATQTATRLKDSGGEKHRNKAEGRKEGLIETRYTDRIKKRTTA